MDKIKRQHNPNLRNILLCQLGQQAGETILTRCFMWAWWIVNIPVALFVLFLAAI